MCIRDRIYTEDNPRLAFSGCIQGRDIKETGPRGVNLVTLEEGRRNVCLLYTSCAFSIGVAATGGFASF